MHLITCNTGRISFLAAKVTETTSDVTSLISSSVRKSIFQTKRVSFLWLKCTSNNLGPISNILRINRRQRGRNYVIRALASLGIYDDCCSENDTSKYRLKIELRCRFSVLRLLHVAKVFNRLERIAENERLAATAFCCHHNQSEKILSVFTAYIKEISLNSCRRGNTIIFCHSADHIIAFSRYSCRFHHRFLNLLLVTQTKASFGEVESRLYKCCFRNLPNSPRFE